VRLDWERAVYQLAKGSALDIPAPEDGRGYRDTRDINWRSDAREAEIVATIRLQHCLLVRSERRHWAGVGVVREDPRPSHSRGPGPLSSAR
jgi:hypothetical protein